MISDSLGRAAQIGRLVGNPITVSMSSNSARSAALKPLTAYRIYVNAACFILFGGVAVDATSSSSPMAANTSEVFRTDDTNLYLAAIMSSSTGMMYITELEI